jgi:DedD protein
MALLDNVFKQRMVGALVLIAVAVIFLPMLFTRQDESHRVLVDAPAAPQTPPTPQVRIEPVPVPEPQALPQEPVPGDDEIGQIAQTPSAPIAPAPPAAKSVPAPAAPAAPVAKPAPKPAAPAPAPAAPATAPAQAATKPATPSGVDANGLSVSWSVQLASLSNRANADNLQKTLRTQGYNAYIRSADGVNRVFVGPLIERAEADRLRDQLDKQQKLKGIVVRFQPERG